MPDARLQRTRAAYDDGDAPRRPYQYLISCGWCGHTHAVPFGYQRVAPHRWQLADCGAVPTFEQFLQNTR